MKNMGLHRKLIFTEAKLKLYISCIFLLVIHNNKAQQNTLILNRVTSSHITYSHSV
jgi:hypothetical protein